MLVLKSLCNISSKKIGLIASIITCAVLITIALGYFGLKWLTYLETNTRICDVYGNRQLIEYFNVHTNEFRLEIKENGRSRWIKHPICCFELNGRVPDNSIRFSRNKSDMLIVNGLEFAISENN